MADFGAKGIIERFSAFILILGLMISIVPILWAGVVFSSDNFEIYWCFICGGVAYIIIIMAIFKIIVIGKIFNIKLKTKI
jgi:hypothetical protein